MDRYNGFLVIFKERVSAFTFNQFFKEIKKLSFVIDVKPITPNIDQDIARAQAREEFKKRILKAVFDD